MTKAAATTAKQPRRAAAKRKPRPMGRPRAYTKKLGDEICAGIAEGNSLRVVCQPPKMPDRSTVFRWLRVYDEFRDSYSIACEQRIEALMDDTLDIADDGSNDWMERRFANSVETVVNREAIERSKLRVQTRQWFASKLKPRKYGDKLDVTSDGKRMQTAPVVISEIKPRLAAEDAAEDDSNITPEGGDNE